MHWNIFSIDFVHRPEADCFYTMNLEHKDILKIHDSKNVSVYQNEIRLISATSSSPHFCHHHHSYQNTSPPTSTNTQPLHPPTSVHHPPNECWVTTVLVWPSVAIDTRPKFHAYNFCNQLNLSYKNINNQLPSEKEK